MAFPVAPDQLPRLIRAAVDVDPRLGYLALALAMLLENLIPPIPSELILPLGGFLVARGDLALLPVVAAALAGTVVGALPWYGLGRLVNEQRLERWLERHGRWVGLAPADLARSRAWFTRHGAALVFWGRMIPGMRTLISVPAGIEMMPFLPFLLWTTAGSLVWTVTLTLAGMALGEGYAGVGPLLEPLGNGSRWFLATVAIVATVALLARAWGQKGTSSSVGSPPPNPLEPPPP